MCVCVCEREGGREDRICVCVCARARACCKFIDQNLSAIFSQALQCILGYMRRGGEGGLHKCAVDVTLQKIGAQS